MQILANLENSSLFAMHTNKVLALGSYTATAYQSIISSLQTLGEFYFKSEHHFKGSNEIIEYFFAEGFDVIVMPNPYGNKRRLETYQQAKANHIPLIAFDRGGLPQTWFFDVGFNADSPTYSPFNWNKPLSEDETIFINKYIKNFRENDYALEKQGRKDSIQCTQERLGLVDKKVILVPFQVPYDTTIKYFASHAQSYQNFVHQINTLDKLVKEYLPDWTVIGKQHPLDHDPLMTKIQLTPKDENINILLQIADAVVCVNSGVGLIASIYETPVYHYGSIYYGHHKLNRGVQNAYEVTSLLKEEGPLPVCTTTRNRLLHYLLTKVYSIGEMETEIRKNKQGHTRNIVTHINFQQLNFPSFSKKKHCLYITPVIPDLINRGSVIRTRQTLEALCEKGFVVDLLVLNRSERKIRSQDLINRLRLSFPDVAHIQVRRFPQWFRKSRHLKTRLISWIHSLLSLDYPFHGKNWIINSESENPYTFRQLIRRYVKFARYDVLFFNYAKMWPGNVETKAIKIVDTHDAQTIRMENDVFQRFPRWKQRLMAKSFFQSEKKTLSAFDKIIAISEKEADYFRGNMNLAKPVYNIDVCIQDPLQSLPNANNCDGKHSYFLFIGSNSNANLTSLLWFLENCWSSIVEQNSEASLLVAGAICRNPKVNKTIQTLQSGQDLVSLLGFVEDSSELYLNCHAVLAPLQHGTGMKVKVIEALAYGKAIVGTSIAFDGIKATHRQDALIADDVKSYQEACLEVLRNQKLRNTLEAGARSLYQKHYTLEANKRAFDLIFQGQDS